jgi:hypothetical protein
MKFGLGSENTGNSYIRLLSLFNMHAMGSARFISLSINKMLGNSG